MNNNAITNSGSPELFSISPIEKGGKRELVLIKGKLSHSSDIQGIASTIQQRPEATKQLQWNRYTITQQKNGVFEVTLSKELSFTIKKNKKHSYTIQSKTETDTKNVDFTVKAYCSQAELRGIASAILHAAPEATSLTWDKYTITKTGAGFEVTLNSETKKFNVTRVFEKVTPKAYSSFKKKLSSPTEFSMLTKIILAIWNFINFSWIAQWISPSKAAEGRDTVQSRNYTSFTSLLNTFSRSFHGQAKSLETLNAHAKTINDNLKTSTGTKTASILLAETIKNGKSPHHIPLGYYKQTAEGLSFSPCILTATRLENNTYRLSVQNSDPEAPAEASFTVLNDQNLEEILEHCIQALTPPPTDGVESSAKKIIQSAIALTEIQMNKGSPTSHAWKNFETIFTKCKKEKETTSHQDTPQAMLYSFILKGGEKEPPSTTISKAAFLLENFGAILFDTLQDVNSLPKSEQYALRKKVLSEYQSLHKKIAHVLGKTKKSMNALFRDLSELQQIEKALADCQSWCEAYEKASLSMNAINSAGITTSNAYARSDTQQETAITAKPLDPVQLKKYMHDISELQQSIHSASPAASTQFHAINDSIDAMIDKKEFALAKRVTRLLLEALPIPKNNEKAEKNSFWDTCDLAVWQNELTRASTFLWEAKRGVSDLSTSPEELSAFATAEAELLYIIFQQGHRFEDTFANKLLHLLQNGTKAQKDALSEIIKTDIPYSIDKAKLKSLCFGMSINQYTQCVAYINQQNNKNTPEISLDNFSAFIFSKTCSDRSYISPTIQNLYEKNLCYFSTNPNDVARMESLHSFFEGLKKHGSRPLVVEALDARLTASYSSAFYEEISRQTSLYKGKAINESYAREKFQQMIYDGFCLEPKDPTTLSLPAAFCGLRRNRVLSATAFELGTTLGPAVSGSGIAGTIELTKLFQKLMDKVKTVPAEQQQEKLLELQRQQMVQELAKMDRISFEINPDYFKQGPYYIIRPKNKAKANTHGVVYLSEHFDWRYVGINVSLPKNVEKNALDFSGDITSNLLFNLLKTSSTSKTASMRERNEATAAASAATSQEASPAETFFTYIMKEARLSKGQTKLDALSVVNALHFAIEYPEKLENAEYRRLLMTTIFQPSLLKEAFKNVPEGVISAIPLLKAEIQRFIAASNKTAALFTMHLIDRLKAFAPESIQNQISSPYEDTYSEKGINKTGKELVTSWSQSQEYNVQDREQKSMAAAHFILMPRTPPLNTKEKADLVRAYTYLKSIYPVDIPQEHMSAIALVEETLDISAATLEEVPSIPIPLPKEITRSKQFASLFSTYKNITGEPLPSKQHEMIFKVTINKNEYKLIYDKISEELSVQRIINGKKYEHVPVALKEMGHTHSTLKEYGIWKNCSDPRDAVAIFTHDLGSQDTSTHFRAKLHATTGRIEKLYSSENYQVVFDTKQEKTNLFPGIHPSRLILMQDTKGKLQKVKILDYDITLNREGDRFVYEKDAQKYYFPTAVESEELFTSNRTLNMLKSSIPLGATQTLIPLVNTKTKEIKLLIIPNPITHIDRAISHTRCEFSQPGVGSPEHPLLELSVSDTKGMSASSCNSYLYLAYLSATERKMECALHFLAKASKTTLKPNETELFLSIAALIESIPPNKSQTAIFLLKATAAIRTIKIKAAIPTGTEQDKEEQYLTHMRDLQELWDQYQQNPRYKLLQENRLYKISAAEEQTLSTMFSEAIHRAITTKPVALNDLFSAPTHEELSQALLIGICFATEEKKTAPKLINERFPSINLLKNLAYYINEILSSAQELDLSFLYRDVVGEKDFLPSIDIARRCLLYLNKIPRPIKKEKYAHISQERFVRMHGAHFSAKISILSFLGSIIGISADTALGMSLTGCTMSFVGPLTALLSESSQKATEKGASISKTKLQEVLKKGSFSKGERKMLLGALLSMPQGKEEVPLRPLLQQALERDINLVKSRHLETLHTHNETVSARPKAIAPAKDTFTLSNAWLTSAPLDPERAFLAPLIRPFTVPSVWIQETRGQRNPVESSDSVLNNAIPAIPRENTPELLQNLLQAGHEKNVQALRAAEDAYEAEKAEKIHFTSTGRTKLIAFIEGGIMQHTKTLSDLEKALEEELRSQRTRANGAIRKLISQRKKGFLTEESFFHELLFIYQKKEGTTNPNLDAIITNILFTRCAKRAFTKALEKSNNPENDKEVCDLLTKSTNIHRLDTVENGIARKKLLVVEFLSDIFLRPKQLETINDLQKTNNLLALARMGLGKTSYILPVLLNWIAEENKLAVACVPTTARAMNMAELNPALSFMFDQSSYTFVASQTLLSDPYAIEEAIFELQEAQRNRGYIVTSIEDIATLKNQCIRNKEELLRLVKEKSALEVHKKDNKEQITALEAKIKQAVALDHGLSRLHKIFTKSDTHVIVDEMDEETRPDLEFNLELEAQRVPSADIRDASFLLTETLMTASSNDIDASQDQIISAHRNEYKAAFSALQQALRSGVPSTLSPETIQMGVRAGIILSRPESQALQSLETYFCSVLKQNACIDFGPDSTSKHLICPRILKTEKPNMRFGEEHELVILHIMYYLTNSVDDSVFLSYIRKKKAHEPEEYERLKTSANALNMNRGQEEAAIINYCKKRPSWKERISLLKDLFNDSQITFSGKQISLNARNTIRDLACSGFSGTAPEAPIEGIRVAEEQTSAETYAKFAGGVGSLSSPVSFFNDASALDDIARDISQDPSIRSVINIGYNIPEGGTRTIISIMRAKVSKTFVYIDEVTRKRMIWRADEAEPHELQGNIVPEDAVVWFEPTDTRGTDFKFALRKGGAIKAITLIGPTINEAKLKQGLWRFRELGNGQTAILKPPASLKERIKNLFNLQENQPVTAGHIVRFIQLNTIEETASINVKTELINITGASQTALRKVLEAVPASKSTWEELTDPSESEELIKTAEVNAYLYQEFQSWFISETSAEATSSPSSLEDSLTFLNKQYDAEILRLQQLKTRLSTKPVKTDSNGKKLFFKQNSLKNPVIASIDATIQQLQAKKATLETRRNAFPEKVLTSVGASKNTQTQQQQQQQQQQMAVGAEKHEKEVAQPLASQLSELQITNASISTIEPLQSLSDDILKNSPASQSIATLFPEIYCSLGAKAVLSAFPTWNGRPLVHLAVTKNAGDRTRPIQISFLCHHDERGLLAESQTEREPLEQPCAIYSINPHPSAEETSSLYLRKKLTELPTITAEHELLAVAKAKLLLGYVTFINSEKAALQKWLRGLQPNLYSHLETILKARSNTTISFIRSLRASNT